MFIYIAQYFVDQDGTWRHLTAVHTSETKSAVLADLYRYFKRRKRRSVKASTRQYRISKFHYGGCRHVANPQAN